jgi:SAM-dependent methyltransferase
MKLFSTEYFNWIRHGCLSSAREIVPLICSIQRPNSVVDVCCGTGEWLKVFREHGAHSVLGVDAQWMKPSMLSIREDEFLVRDIAKPLDIEGTFDMALMLEAVQHVPAHRARDMVRTLTRLAPYVLFSAPIPHQGGSGDDVNEQWPEYWNAYFEEEGFVCVDVLRRLIWTNERVEWWYAQNLLLFVRKKEVSRSTLLRMALEASPSPPLPLVHPKLYASKSDMFVPQPVSAAKRIARIVNFRFKTAMSS